MLKNKIVKKLLRWFGISSLVILGLLLVGYIYEPFAEKADEKTYPPPGKLVDVGGYKLHIHCIGKGNPTVVIDAGSGDWSASWKEVQDKVAKNTRVCTYDRAGMGWSDSGPNPRTAKQFAKELHTLLQKTNISKPYVLVGHSAGGFNVRVYTHEYPTEVSGVVLVDSMSPRQFSSSVMNAHNTSTTKENSPLTLFARLGIVRAFTTIAGIIENASAEEKAQYALNSHPKFTQTLLDEGEGLPESAYQASQVTSFGEKPLIVLSRGKENPSQKSWDEWQKELLHLSKRSQHMTAKSSGHSIHVEQPDAAVDAISRMIKLINLEETNI